MNNQSITEKASGRIAYLVDVIPPLLRKIPADEFSYKPHPTKWSRKQIIGHLVDSATNNHHRFIRSRIENEPDIFYNQDDWNNLSHYNEMEGDDVIGLWTAYNRFLAELIKNIKEEDLNRTCKTGKNVPYTLGYIIEDYVVHLEHHLKQVVSY